ncbi:hypothetical protein EJV46_01155, partial [Roseococcus sp. SYP-B2431]|uniref:hypothetical protein n=1 Tax=Roseococcus sp. SYP-B2431 TaxID=2496640 RepID=UPI0010E42471
MAVLEQEASLTLPQHRNTGLPLLGPPDLLRRPTGSDWIGGMLTHPNLRNAWSVLERSFRQLIESGKLSMTGVQLAPERLTMSQAIPDVWAADMVFDLDRNAIKIAEYRFGSISIRPARRVAAAAEAPAFANADRAASTEGGKRGRPKFPLEEMIVIATERLTTRHKGQEMEAFELRRLFAARHPGRPAPALRTIAVHVTEIYSAA